jgi:KUP system potassium uptake protein
VKTREIPHVPPQDRLSIEDLGDGVHRIRLYYGFMDEPNVPQALSGIGAAGRAPLDPENTTYFLGRETIIATRRAGMALWRERLFALISRNATTATAYFGIPPDRVVELGEQVEI